MVDLSNVLSISEAARRVPGGKGNKGVHCLTIWRWINKGIHGPDGQTIKLHSVRVGKRVFVPQESLDAFIQACNPDLQSDRLPIRSPAKRKREHEAAAKHLAAMGV